MFFLAPTLLAGLALVAAPIILHLAMRRQPKQMMFPALRLLRRNKRQNETRLQLRRWLLLLLRCAAVVLLALALARPVLRPPSTDRAAGTDGTGLAMALVIDNGPNMEYRFGNQTRLEAARDMATWLTDSLPPDASVITVDRSQAGLASVGDPDSAALRIDRMQSTAATQSLGAAVRQAIEQLAEAPAAQRVACLFTDLSQGAWDQQAQAEAAEALEILPGLELRIVDVGATDPTNVGLTSLKLANEAPVVGEVLRIQATIQATGRWQNDLVAQLWLDGDHSQEPVKRDERRVSMSETNPTEITFTLEGLEPGLHSGYLQLLSGDALQADDRRYFSVRVRQPPSLLIAAPRVEDALFVREALSPSNLPPGVVERYAAQVIRYDQLAETNWDENSVILLLDPPTLESREWRRLGDYVTAGGGLGLMLGRNTDIKSFNGASTQAIVPGTLRWTSREETYLRPVDYAHPAVAPLRQYADSLPWVAFPVFRRWELENLNEGSLVVARYADSQPAIVERTMGRGRVLMMTTPLSDRLDQSDPWNLLPTGQDPWPFFLLIDSMTDYLSGWRGEQLNYRSGESIIVPLESDAETPTYVLRTPSGEALRETVPPGAREVAIGFASESGVYRIETGGQAKRLHHRFAVNQAEESVQLDRISFEEIEAALGADRVSLIQDRESLSRSIDLGRIGRELYGFALVLVVAAFAAEQIVSNRFYREEVTQDQQRA